jgi:hypothetical protein
VVTIRIRRRRSCRERGFIGAISQQWNQGAVQNICYRRQCRDQVPPCDSLALPAHDRSSENFMTISMAHIQPIVALIAGILILVMPRLLNFIVAIYLIFIGIIGLGIIK